VSSDFKQEALRDRELRSGVPRPMPGKPGYTPSLLSDRTDVRVERHGEAVGVTVEHHSLAELTTTSRGRTTWCARCRTGRHSRCHGRRRVHGLGFLPCGCPKCRPARPKLLQNKA
jgi:hypothetical protein